MSMTVYGVPLSPFVRKVCLALQEKGLDYRLEIVAPFQQPEWFYDISPLGRIPALKDGDLPLADSAVIAQYLEDQYPHSVRLYGSSPAERARIHWLEKYADYELAPLTTFCVFVNRVLNPTRGQACDEAAIRQVMEEKLPKHFDYLERELGDAQFFGGATLSAADLAFACQLINLQHGGESLDAGRWPRLAALHERLCQRSSVQALLPQEHSLLEKLRAQAGA